MKPRKITPKSQNTESETVDLSGTRRDSPGERVDNPADLPYWKPGKVLLDHYIVRSKLGEGGSGVVYLVEGTIVEQSAFAVKILKQDRREQTSDRLCIISELRSWMTLPRHPHIVTCYFFRTIDNNLAIFSEYVDGGSLNQWIEQSAIEGLPQIIDIAIQIAWGLQVTHDSGFVHQDMKPGNILMTKDGSAKITDFGLSAIRKIPAVPTVSTGTKETTYVKSTGMTIAFCSPEQAAGTKISRKSDIWSFGLTLLAMLNGGVTWPIGTVARSLLASFRQQMETAGRVAIPAAVWMVLDRCFREDPFDRWDNILDVIGPLKEAYRELTGRDYQRQEFLPVLLPDETAGRTKSLPPRYGHSRSALEWLSIACEKAGIDSAGRIVDEKSINHKAFIQILSDLELFEEARSILFALPQRSFSDRSIQVLLMELNLDKTTVLEELNDYPGVIEASNEAIDRYNGIESPGRHETLLLHLAHESKANAYIQTGRLKKAVSVFQEQVKLIDPSSDHPKIIPAFLRLTLARTYTDLGVAYLNLGETEAALESTRNGMKLLPLLRNISSVTRRNYYALLYVNLGAIFNLKGQFNVSIEYSQKAVRLLRRLLRSKPSDIIIHHLTTAYSNIAYGFERAGKYQQALDNIDRAIKVLSRRLEQAWTDRLAFTLVLNLVNQTSTLIRTKEYERAGESALESNRIMNELVVQRGHTEWVIYLAISYANLGSISSNLNQFDQSIQMYDKAIKILEQAVEQGKQNELLPEAVCYRAERSLTLLRYQPSEENARSALAAVTRFDTVMKEIQSSDLADNLEWTWNELALLKELHHF